jgi:transcription-repair coupling factor (superfamily II helicase)
LHNRVQSIQRRAGYIQKLVPEARIAIAHGQMPERDLESVMVEFVTGKINVLVCTSIIESGLDIPRANTIIIERADAFGLADLYQMRGRVGRSHMRAYAYLMTPPESAMTPDAVKRLAVIQEHSNLGQGFRIALRDMEIRGAGNILGTSQSGHVAQVGYEMYLDLLEEAVQEIKGEAPPPKINPEILLQIEAYIPEEYVPDPQQRMNLYKRLSRSSGAAEINEIEDEIFDLYGKAPVQVLTLIRIMRLRLLMKELLILRLDYNGKDLIFAFNEDTSVNPQFMALWAQHDKRVRLFPENKFSYRVGSIDPEARIDQCFGLLQKLEKGLGAGTSSDQGAVMSPVTKIKRPEGLKRGKI